MYSSVAFFNFFLIQGRNLELKTWSRAWNTNSVFQQSTTLERVNTVRHPSLCLPEILKVSGQIDYNCHYFINTSYSRRIAALNMVPVLQNLLVKSKSSKWQIPPTKPCPCLGSNPRTLRGLRMKPRDILWRSGPRRARNGTAAIQTQ